MKKLLFILTTLISTAVFGADLPSPNALMESARELNNVQSKLTKIIEVSTDRIVSTKNFDPVVENIRGEAHQFRIAALQSIILHGNPQIDLRDYRLGPRNANPESRDELSGTIVGSYIRINTIIEFLDSAERLIDSSGVAAQLKLVRNELASVNSRWSGFVANELKRFSGK